LAILIPKLCQSRSEETFWWVMGRKVQECNTPPVKIEVLNFGVSGYGTAQELLTLREQVWKYSPDIVMLAVTTNNDITDNSRALKKTEGSLTSFTMTNHLTLDTHSEFASLSSRQSESVASAGGCVTTHEWAGNYQVSSWLQNSPASWRARRSQEVKPPLGTQMRMGTRDKRLT